jgi:polar amino acid transport system substrate-binding protein
MPRTPRFAALSLSLLFVLAACGASSTPTPSTGGSVPVATSRASSAPSTPSGSVPAATSGTGATPAASPIAIPDGQLILAGNLFICSDIPYPPQEFFDDQGNPTGSDIDIGSEIASRLGLIPHIENTVFLTIIPALTGGKCDVIVSAQNINADRLTQVDMIPYFQAGQAFLVQKGNPAGINAPVDLCGKKVAAETGTTEVDNLTGAGDFKKTGFPSICSKAGKPDPTPKPYDKDPDALNALQAGTVDAYFGDLPPVVNYATLHPDQFEVSPIPPLAPAIEGISVAKPAAGSATPHTALYDAVKTTLIAMINDGTYLTILKKYAVDSGAITVDQVNKGK